MRSIIIFLGVIVSVLFPFHSKAASSEVIISGSAQFDSSLSENYMEKHGYVFIEESYYQSFLKTNMYGLKNAEILIKNEYGNVLGTAMTDKEGNFTVTVPKESDYKIIVRFKGHEIIKQALLPKIENVIVYAGFFNSDTVGAWIAEDYRAAAESAKEPAEHAGVITSFSRSYR